MKHIKKTSVARPLLAASDIEEWFDDLVNAIACDVNPDKDKCKPDKDWTPW